MAGIGEAAMVAGIKPKKPAAKVLHHLEIHPMMGGGHEVQHHYQDYRHETKHVKFKAGDGEKMLAHVAHHTGIEEQSESEPETQFEETDI